MLVWGILNDTVTWILFAVMLCVRQTSYSQSSQKQNQICWLNLCLHNACFHFQSRKMCLYCNLASNTNRSGEMHTGYIQDTLALEKVTWIWVLFFLTAICCIYLSHYTSKESLLRKIILNTASFIQFWQRFQIYSFVNSMCFSLQ